LLRYSNSSYDVLRLETLKPFISLLDKNFSKLFLIDNEWS